MRPHHLNSELRTRNSELLIAIGFLLAFSLSARADLITATVAITNAAGTTNGQTITLNASVRTWTNNVYTPAAQILTNSTPTGAATNLFNHLGFAPLAGTSVSYGSSTSLVVRGFPNSTLTVTLSDGYGTVVYTTNTTTSAQVLRVPYSVESAAAQTNGATGIVDWLNLTAATNQLKQASPAFAQLLGTTNTQTVSGNKTLTGTLYITNANGVSNVIYSAVLPSPISTNAVNYGNAFRSPGSASYSEQFGTSAAASGTASTAIGYGAVASGLNDSALGTAAVASGGQSSAIGGSATASGANSLALGASATASALSSTALGTSANSIYQYSTAIGRSATATKDNQVVLGTSAEVITIPGSIEHLKTTGTNSFSDLALRRFAITSLANGNNAGVIIGTNSFVEVSGPTAAFTINGMTGSPLRDGHLVVILNQTGYDMTVAHQSGVEPTAANRIITLTGADRTTTGNGAATFLYNANTARWMLIAFDP